MIPRPGLPAAGSGGSGPVGRSARSRTRNTSVVRPSLSPPSALWCLPLLSVRRPCRDLTGARNDFREPLNSTLQGGEEVADFLVDGRLAGLVERAANLRAEPGDSACGAARPPAGRAPRCGPQVPPDHRRGRPGSIASSGSGPPRCGRPLRASSGREQRRPGASPGPRLTPSYRVASCYDTSLLVSRRMDVIHGPIAFSVAPRRRVAA